MLYNLHQSGWPTTDDLIAVMDMEVCTVCGERIDPRDLRTAGMVIEAVDSGVCGICQQEPDEKGWWCIENKLPRYGSIILGYEKIIGMFILKYIGDGIFITGETDRKRITHWMPLPEPPKA